MAIDFNQLQMPNIAGNFMQGLQFAQQQQAAQEQQRQAQWAAQQAKQAMQTVYDNPTPENISRFYMQYPEYKKQFEESRAPLNDAAKVEDLGVASRAFVLLGNGKIDEVASMLDGRVGALKNTPGKETEAKALEAVIQIIKTDPQAGKQLLGMKIAAADPDLYKTVFGQGEKTTMEKEYDAISARSGKGVADSWWEAQITKDKLIPVAGVGLFRAEDLGEQENLPRINTKEEADKLAPGARFIAPDGSIKTKPGGGVSNGTGSFRPSGN